MRYKSFRTLADEYDCSIDTVRRTVRRMQNYIGTRYPPEVVLTVGREWRIEESAFIDWCKWHPAIVMGYEVPEYELGEKNEGSIYTDKELIFSQRRNA